MPYLLRTRECQACNRTTPWELTDSVVLVLEPFDRVSGRDFVGGADLAVLLLSEGDSGTGSSHTTVKVHSVDTDAWIVLDVQINVLLNTESKVSRGREIRFLQLVFPNFESTLENLLCLGSSDGDVDRDLFVTSDTERSDCVSGLGVDGCLTGQLLEHLGCSGQSITRLSHTDIEDELLDLEFPHRVVGLGIGHDDMIS